jgi:hypothetical protein
MKAGQTTDLTRNGIARGYVVVPEFPSTSGTILLIGGLFGVMVIIQRFKMKNEERKNKNEVSKKYLRPKIFSGDDK